MLLDYLKGLPSASSDESVTSSWNERALLTIRQFAALGRLRITGRRCRLEFPGRTIPVGWWGEEIPASHFTHGVIWAFDDNLVLTPQVWGPPFLAMEPGAPDYVLDLFPSLPTVDPRTGTVEGWQELTVRADEARLRWPQLPDGARGPSRGSAKLRKAIQMAISELGRPGRGGCGWKSFNDRVWALCEVPPGAPGYSARTIRRMEKELTS
jgi:hypothetical protein